VELERRSAALTQAVRPWTSTVPRNCLTPRETTPSQCQPAITRVLGQLHL